MAFDLRLLENLLHQEEGPALDFKQEQYPFDNADVGMKSELLKDILALVNSWRLTTAYILIGVKEVKGGRSEIVGVAEHLDDANLHQFVNGKTQRPVEFSYLPFHVEGVDIGVVEVPIQERPIYLTSRFGPLREHTVLLRDGSSTRVATPDEITKMGVEQALGGSSQFILEWADPYGDKVLLSPHMVQSLVLEPRLPPKSFAPRRPYGLGASPLANSSYSPEIIACTAERNLLTPLGFRLQNLGRSPGRRIRFSGRIAKLDGLAIQDRIDDLPSPNLNLTPSYFPDPALSTDDEPSLSIAEFDDHWGVVVDFGDVRPGDDVWTDSNLFVGSTHPGTISLQGELRGDSIPEPAKCELEIRIAVERRAMTIDDVAPYLSKR